MRNPLEVEVLLSGIAEETSEDPYLFSTCIGEGGMSRVYLNSLEEAEKFTQFAVFPEFPQYLKREGHKKKLMLSYNRHGEVLLNNFSLNLECTNGGRQIDGFMHLIRSLYEGVVLRELVGGRNIPQFKDFKFCIDLGGRVYSVLTLDCAAGHNFSRLVKEKKISLHHIAKSIASIALALEQVHAQGFVHRDVKPSNVMYSFNSREATLLDFGICQHQGNYPVTRSIPHDLQLLLELGDREPCGVLAGTAGYMSPEQVYAFLSEKDPVKTPKSDIFALAATAIYALKGKAAFKTDLNKFITEMVGYGNTRAGIILDETAMLAEERFSQKLPENVLNALEQALDKDPCNRNLQPLFESMLSLANEREYSRIIFPSVHETAGFSNVEITRNERPTYNYIDTYVGDLTFLESNHIELIADP